jgi:hypothetical protein
MRYQGSSMRRVVRERVCVCAWSVTHGSGSTAPLRASTQPCGPMDVQHCPVLGSSFASVYSIAHSSHVERHTDDAHITPEQLYLCEWAGGHA